MAGGYAEKHGFGRVGRIPTPTGIPVGDINSYLVFPEAGSDSLTLVDCGVKKPDAFDALRTGFKAHGWAFEQIDRILITHAHLDHFGQAKRLRDLSGATVYASEIEAGRMTEHWLPSAERSPVVQAFFRRWAVPDEAFEIDPVKAKMASQWLDPIEVDEIVSEGDRIDAGGLTLEVFETPGHCEGHIVFYERDTGLLFSGDHLLTDISPVPLLAFPEHEDEPRKRSLELFMDSLDKVDALDCQAVFPSHGDVIWDHRELTRGYRLHHQRRLLQFRRYLADGPRTPWAIALEMFPKYVHKEPFLVMSEVIGHLDLLETEGHIVLETRDGVDHVHLAGDPPAADEEPEA